MNQLDFWLDFFCQEAALSSLELNSVCYSLITLAIPLALKLGRRSDSPGQLVKSDSASTSGVSSLVDEAMISIANSSQVMLTE